MLALAQESTPVIDAVHKGHAVGHEQDGVDAVRAALTADGDVNELDKTGWTPLMWAALECRAHAAR
jgi:ankyrin repeat protein